MVHITRTTRSWPAPDFGAEVKTKRQRSAATFNIRLFRLLRSITFDTLNATEDYKSLIADSETLIDIVLMKAIDIGGKKIVSSYDLGMNGKTGSSKRFEYEGKITDEKLVDITEKAVKEACDNFKPGMMEKYYASRKEGARKGGQASKRSPTFSILHYHETRHLPRREAEAEIGFSTRTYFGLKKKYVALSAEGKMEEELARLTDARTNAKMKLRNKPKG